MSEPRITSAVGPTQSLSHVTYGSGLWVHTVDSPRLGALTLKVCELSRWSMPVATALPMCGSL